MERLQCTLPLRSHSDALLDLQIQQQQQQQQQQLLNGLCLRDPGELASEHSETLTQYTTLVVLKLLTSTPRPPSLPLGFNSKNLGETAETNMNNR